MSAKPEINEPQSPSDPSLGDVTIPDVSPLDVTNTPPENLLYQLNAAVYFTEGKSVNGLIRLTNDLIITVTNTNNNMIRINSLSIFNINNIQITKWEPVKTSNDLYLFTPVEYKIFTNEFDTNYFVYYGNISTLNDFEMTDDRTLYHFYSIFYDRWIEGKKGYFRWNNSKASTFSYNFTNPIPGVVKTIVIKKYND
jgi:hypothetical protein